MFIDKFCLKCLNFTIASSQILCAKSIEIIAISSDNRSFIRLKQVAYAFEYDLNLILFGQLCGSNITYIDNKNAMILVQKS